MIDKTLYDRIIEKKKRLDKLRPLPKTALEKLKHQFSIELAYNSNAIEGNTLTLKETEMVIEEGITISGKPLKDHIEAKNHQKAFELMNSLAKKNVKISQEEIKEIHKSILRNIDDEYAGKYRNVNVRITGAIKSPPRHEKVPRLMEDFVKEINKNPDKLNDIELTSALHYRFVEIHPFIDGNGRTARLLTNLFLISRGYPISMILKVDRKKYYFTLKEADNGNLEPFNNFIARSIERSLDLYLDVFEGGSEYVSLREASQESRYSQEYLSLLARRGKIEAIKLGRNWHIKKEDLKKYTESMKK